MNQTPLLQVEGLTKYFPVTSGIMRKVTGHIRALDGVSFDLPRGKVLGVVGESGSGKSTLGRSLLRLIEPTAGQITFSGGDVLSFGKEEMKRYRKDAQIIFQDPLASLNPRKTVFDCIGEGLLFHGLVKGPNQQKEKVAEVLSQVGLSPDVMHRYPHQFSGGQQQRIAIGRAIALNPHLIVCDEALSSLDVSVQSQILELLRELQKKFSLSYVFISHDLSAVKYLCDEVIVLYQGQMMETGTVQKLFTHPEDPYTKALLSAIPKDHPLHKKNIFL